MIIWNSSVRNKKITDSRSKWSTDKALALNAHLKRATNFYYPSGLKKMAKKHQLPALSGQLAFFDQATANSKTKKSS